MSNIERREFIKSIGSGSLGAAAIAAAGFTATGCKREVKASETPKRVLMKIGCQHGGTLTQNLEFQTRHGVFNMDAGSPKAIEGVGWDLEDSLVMKDACDKYGISLDAYHLPLSSAGIERVSTPNIMLGKSPERDRGRQW